MSKIIISKVCNIPNSADLTVEITVDEYGCIVNIGQKFVIAWEQMDKLELLSEIFAEINVRLFKIIVTMLGKIHQSKEVYKSLLC